MEWSAREGLLGTLAVAQNSDGGWGYFGGGTSWLEPSCWAALALLSERGWASRSRAAADLARTWQRADGAIRPASAVDEAGWATSLWVILESALGRADQAVKRAVLWLAAEHGAEGHVWRRMLSRAAARGDGPELELYGRPWSGGTSSWVEPTALAVLALEKAEQIWQVDSLLAERVSRRMRLGRAMLLNRRCPDGGWNYGVPRALGSPLPSYPETTAMALLGLQQADPAALAASYRAANAGLAAAHPASSAPWLRLALVLHGQAGQAEAWRMRRGHLDVPLASACVLASSRESAGVVATRRIAS